MFAGDRVVQAIKDQGIFARMKWGTIMAIEKARAHLAALGLDDRIMEFEQSCAPCEWVDVAKLL